MSPHLLSRTLQPTRMTAKLVDGICLTGCCNVDALLVIISNSIHSSVGLEATTLVLYFPPHSIRKAKASLAVDTSSIFW
jgi:hypothetical protein